MTSLSSTPSLTQLLLLVVLAATCFVCSLAQDGDGTAQQPSSPKPADDPRCIAEKYKCLLDGEPTLGFTSDPSTIGPGAPYPKCLVGPEWDTILGDLGFGKAKRDFVPTLQFDNWLSAEISENMFRMLAEEAMGFEIEPFTIGGANGFDTLCCDKHHVAIEKWPSRKMPNDDDHFTLAEIPIGYEGGSGLFVPKHTVDSFPLSTAYNAYKFLPEYSNIFPKGYSTPCIEASKDASAGCKEGNYVCNDEKWPNTTCSPQGRYVPPQCQANPTECQEIYMANPTWDMGFFESLIKNTGLKFILVYLGYTNHVTKVKAENLAKNNFMFYWWEPDPLVSLVGAESVAFKSPTFDCRSKQNTDPALSGGDCDYGKALLQKVARRSSLALDSDFKFFFEAFQLSATDMKNMLSQHTSAGGSLNTYNISCNWLKNNYGTWKDWIRNTPPPAENTTFVKAAAEEKDSTTLIAVSVSLVGGAVLIGVAVAATMYLRAQKAVKHAPKKPPLTLVFTDIESSTHLWENHGTNMANAVDIHHEVIRECIEENNCYEIKVVGDAFMFAAESLIDATNCCLAIQRRLMEAKWPESIKYWKGDDDMTGLWFGLRVRMGVHLCTEVEPKFDMVHGRYDYYGHDVNVSARVQAVASGGQILMTEDTYRQLKEHPDYKDMIGEDAMTQKFCSGHEMKGVAEPVTLYSIIPEHLAGRTFDPIPGTVDETTAGAGGFCNSTNDTMSQGSSAAGGGRIMMRMLRQVFGLLPNQKEKDILLNTLLSAKGVQTKTGPFARRLKTLGALLDEAAPEKGAIALDTMNASRRMSLQQQQSSAAVTPSSMAETSHHPNAVTPDE